MPINSKQANFIRACERAARGLLDAQNVSEGLDDEKTETGILDDAAFTDAIIQEVRPDLTKQMLADLFVTFEAFEALRSAGHGTNLSRIAP